MIWKNKSQDYFAAKSIQGIIDTFPNKWQLLYPEKSSATIAKKKLNDDKVQIITSGGAGNGPLFLGYVGEGLADASVLGATYGAPNAYAIYRVAKHIASDKGILLLYNNFAGDYLNNDMAKELLELDGIKVGSFACHDDMGTHLNSEDKTERNGREGIALLIKIAASLSEQGYSLDEIISELHATSKRLATLSLTANSDFTEYILGAGFSGEPGIEQKKGNLEVACRDALDKICLELNLQSGDDLLLMINRFRLSSYPESFLVANLANEILAENYNVKALRVGAYSNIADEYGYSFSVLKLDSGNLSYFEDYIKTDAFWL